MKKFIQIRENIPPSIAEQERFFPMRSANKTATPTGWNNSQTWQTLDDIPSDKYFGMAITGTNLALIDGDHIRDAVTGEVFPEAQAALDRILQYGETYTEYSTSGTGVHLIIDLGDYAEDFPTISNGSSQIILPTMRSSEYEALSADEQKEVPKIEIFYHVGGRYVLLTGHCEEVHEVASNETAAAMLRECLKMVDECHDSAAAERPSDKPALTINETDRQRILDALPYINPEDRETWIRVGMALYNCGMPFDVWDEWSQGSEKYDDGRDEPTDKKWKGFMRNSHNWNIGTIIRLAKEGGYKPRADNPEKIDLDHFHRFRIDKNGNKIPIDIHDENICEYICSNARIIVVAGQPYIYTDGVYKADNDGLKIKKMIRKLIYPQLIKNSRIEGCYKLLISEPNLHYDPADLNRYPKEWINCKNGMLDPIKMELHAHDPDYLSINQIPIEWIPQEVPSDCISYQYIESLIPDEDDREMFLQYSGLCLTADTSQQKFLILYGPGGTGKSTVIRMECNVVGNDNISGLSLQDINKRFYPTCLLGKLLNACADIPSAKMKVVDVIKKIIGEDIIMGEYKCGDTFWFRSYAKLLFSANTIPKVYDDKTDAYYRRLMILEIGRKARHFDNLSERLFDDRQNFFTMMVNALHRMYENGGLFESSNSKAHVNRLYVGSDTVYAFLEELTEKSANDKVRRKKLFDTYQKYCEEESRTPLTAFKFKENLENKGYLICKVDGYDFVKGLKLKDYV